MHRTALGIITVVLVALPATASAQASSPDATTAPPAGPSTSGGTVTVSPDQAALEAEQAAVESEGREPQGQVVESDLDREADEPPTEVYNHEGQLELRAGVAVPFVFAVKYGEGPRCSDELDDDGDPQTFCRRFGATLLDLELGFGVSPTVELGLIARLGLADDDAAEAKPLGLAFGARAYTSPDAMFKGYFGFRVIMDITSSETPEWSTVDIGMRGELGLQLDVLRYLGIYVQLGESISFLRGFYFVTDGSAGLQVRFP